MAPIVVRLGELFKRHGRRRTPSIENILIESPTNLSESVNASAFDLSAKVHQDGTHNLVFSPLSIHIVLSMVLAGARGLTAGEISRVLRISGLGDHAHAEYGELTALLGRIGKGPNVDLAIANSLWTHLGYELLDVFTDLVQTRYSSIIREVDFQTDSDTACKQINRWVADATRDRIPELMSKEMLGPLTRLVAVNATYFMSEWDLKFDPEDTRNEPFFLLDGERVDVPTMHQTAYFSYLKTHEAQILRLPYLSPLSMIVILPRQRNGLPDLEKKIHPEVIRRWLAGTDHVEVNVSLPRFRIETHLALTDVLYSLGMATAFSPGEADFTGMATEETLNRLGKLFLSGVISKSFIKVDETGTEAAAVTGMCMPLAARNPLPPITFKADHPFLFLITLNLNGAILFMGRVVDPR